jgi:hypothetical protein
MMQYFGLLKSGLFPDEPKNYKLLKKDFAP